ncbi:MAG: HEAT repeat domain-containing protein [Pseudonocardia sp.]|nr:HEAT repeat domain-containing protein [Pseudonocardia sp.]
MKLSVIVRFRNEGAYLGTVLNAVREQHCEQSVEIVAIDNASTDDSRRIAERYADVVLDITDYRPGAALNRAIESCSGDALVVLSAHAIPANRRWLAKLTSWLPDTRVLGIYGAQLYPITSRFLDKRDLDIFSDLRPRVESSDSDFWNANSTFLRSRWDKEQFDEIVIELEDHHWTKKILPHRDLRVRFEPEALVYHYGHEARNDRTFIPPTGATAEEHLAAAVAVLEARDEPWPAVMSAGLTLASLSDHLEIDRAVPALGRTLLEHDDFDVRWRVAGALGRIGTPEAARFLIAGLRDPSFYVCNESAWALGRAGHVGTAELLTAIDTLEPVHLPHAAMALGLSGDRSAAAQGVLLLRDSICSGTVEQVRDSLYSLGEIAEVEGTAALASLVTRCLESDVNEVARAAAWCWGMLVSHHPDAKSLDSHRLTSLVERHPVETVRFEAVVALGWAARVKQDSRLVQEVLRVLDTDAVGRVRYGAMQTLRLLASAGVDCRAEVEAHDDDTDFGVLFERSLILGESMDLTWTAPPVELKG